MSKNDLEEENQSLRQQNRLYKSQLQEYEKAFQFGLESQMFTQQKSRLVQELKKQIHPKDLISWVRTQNIVDPIKQIVQLMEKMPLSEEILLDDTLGFAESLEEKIDVSVFTEVDKSNLEILIYTLSLLYGILAHQKEKKLS